MGADEMWGDPHLTRAFGTRLFVTADPKLIRAILEIGRASCRERV